MNQNTMMVSLINLKEKVHKLYRNRFLIINPIVKGLIAFIVLYITVKMFPYNSRVNDNMILAAVSVVQAFLPFSFLYYIASAVILCNLWNVSFDIFAAFVMFVIICAISYFRINGRYSYIAAIIPVLFFFHLEIAVPAVLGIALGLEAFFPTAAGVIIYYFSVILKDSGELLSNTDSSDVGVGLQHVLTGLLTNKTFLVMLAAVCLTLLASALLRKLFYEKAWLVAMTLGNVLMAFLVLCGRLYFNLDLPVWQVLLETVLGIVFCLVYEFFRGIGDVSRIERTVFEDNEYIYYVKAVPKIRLTKAEPNIKVMNTEVLNEEKKLSDSAEKATEENTEAEKIVESEKDESLPEKVTETAEMETESEQIIETANIETGTVEDPEEISLADSNEARVLDEESELTVETENDELAETESGQSDQIEETGEKSDEH